MSRETLNQMNAIFQICVDQRGAGRFSGRVFSRRLTAPLTFHGMDHLLLQLERLMDAQNYPQAYQRPRTFGSKQPAACTDGPELPENAMTEETVSAARGAEATFQLHVLTRQNATWQGGIRWPDGTVEEYASDLELMALIEGKLC